jgi:hypothetical protein
VIDATTAVILGGVAIVGALLCLSPRLRDSARRTVEGYAQPGSDAESRKVTFAILVVLVLGFLWLILVCAPGIEADCRARGGENHWVGARGSHECIAADGTVLYKSGWGSR